MISPPGTLRLVSPDKYCNHATSATACAFFCSSDAPSPPSSTSTLTSQPSNPRSSARSTR